MPSALKFAQESNLSTHREAKTMFLKKEGGSKKFEAFESKVRDICHNVDWKLRVETNSSKSSESVSSHSNRDKPRASSIKVKALGI